MIMIKFNKPVDKVVVEADAAKIKFGTLSTHAPVLPTAPTRPHKLFSTPNDPLIDKSITYLQTNFSKLFSDNERQLRIMVKRLVTCELNTIMNWGDEALTEQRDILKVVTTRLSEFSQLHGSELLAEILDGSNKPLQGGILQRFTSGLHKPTENYGNRIEALKIRLKGIADPIMDYRNKIAASTLPLWSASIAAVNTCVPITDDTIEEAMLNRRRILQQAVQNLQVASAQLEQTRTMIIKQQSEVDYIMNVVLPSLDLAKP